MSSVVGVDGTDVERTFRLVDGEVPGDGLLGCWLDIGELLDRRGDLGLCSNMGGHSRMRMRMMMIPGSLAAFLASTSRFHCGSAFRRSCMDDYIQCAGVLSLSHVSVFQSASSMRPKFNKMHENNKPAP